MGTGFNLINPNTRNKKDEPLYDKEYEEQMSKFINSSQFKKLLMGKFQLDTGFNTVNVSFIISSFKKLITLDYDAVHKFVIDPNTFSNYWKTHSLYIKQLQHFMAYSSFPVLA